MALRPSDINRMHAKDLSRWAPKPKERKATEIFLDSDKDDINRRGQEVLHELLHPETAQDRLVNEAYRYVNERYATMAEAGLPTSMARRMDGMRSIPGTNVPMEVRIPGAGIETRVHTNYGDMNPMTGQRDIDPYIDPVTGRGMVTNLGNRVGQDQMDGYTKASEYVQQQLGRLGGLKIEANHSDDRYATDFRNGAIKVDGETTRPSWRERGDGVQAYTKVVDADNPDAPANRMAPAIRDMLRDIIRKNPNAGIQEVIAIAGNRLDGGYNRRGDIMPPIKGKVLDESKDGILLTVLSDKYHQLNKDVHDTIPVPVEGAYYQDLNGMRRTLEDISGKELSRGLQVRPNYGNNRDGAPRGRVYVTPSPERAREFTVDMSQISPRVRQLFDYNQ